MTASTTVEMKLGGRPGWVRPSRTGMPAEG